MTIAIAGGGVYGVDNDDWFVGIIRNRRGALGMLVVQDTRDMWRTPLINPQ